MEKIHTGRDHRDAAGSSGSAFASRTTGDVCRQLGDSEQSYYRWRREYGGLKVEQAKPLKELEKKNARLCKAVSDLTLDKLFLQEAARGNFLALQVADWLSNVFVLSLACRNTASEGFWASIDRPSARCRGVAVTRMR